jgi:exodeoxyribonuclease VII small subunit
MTAEEAKAPTFEAALAELEKVVEDLEDGQIGLEEGLARFEQGIKLLRHCHALINQAEQRIQILSGVDESGQPILQPLATEK